MDGYGGYPRERSGRGRYDAGYDRGRTPHSGYGTDFGRYGTPFPGATGYPSARWGWGPIGWPGWAGWGPGLEYWPYAALPDYGFGGTYPASRRRPQASPTYGRGGDRALRRWAERYGYDLEYSIPPRRR